jgi:hypothetical protein
MRIAADLSVKKCWPNLGFLEEMPALDAFIDPRSACR